jgi:hypothetical protein
MQKTISQLLAAALVTALAAEFSPWAYAAEQPPASAPPAKEGKATKGKIGKPLVFSGKIAAIDKIEKTITLAGKAKNRVFYLTSQTRITKAGKPATFDDAVVGEVVGGQARVKPDGKNELISLRIGPKPEGKAKSAVKPKQPKEDKPPAEKK